MFSLDIDECSSSNGGCEHTCVNTDQSFYCTCRQGYTLKADQQTCEGTLTQLNSYVSLNFNTFLINFLLIKTPFCYLFAANSCPSLSTPSNGQISLSSGLVKGSTATYTCNNGYKATYSDTRYCQTDGQWSGGEPSCIRKCCLEASLIQSTN